MSWCIANSEFRLCLKNCSLSRNPTSPKNTNFSIPKSNRIANKVFHLLGISTHKLHTCGFAVLKLRFHCHRDIFEPSAFKDFNKWSKFDKKVYKNFSAKILGFKCYYLRYFSSSRSYTTSHSLLNDRPRQII